MNISKLHRGLITRTAGQSKLMDPCTRPLQDMPASTRASLAKEMHASVPGDHACIPCMLHLVMTRKCSRGGTWHASNQPRRTRQLRRAHLTSKEMHASGALKARRMHLLAPKDARVLHGTHANRGGAYLLPSKSSATGGSTPLRTNTGGSILPKIDPGGSVLSGVNAGGSISPHSYEHVRSAQQNPSTRRKGRPRTRKSPQARANQLDPSTSPGPDLRKQLNKKRRASRVTPHCRCERIIAFVHADCTCSSPTQTKSVFERLSVTSSAELTKRFHFNDEAMPSEDEFIEVSVNMVDKDTGKQP